MVEPVAAAQQADPADMEAWAAENASQPAATAMPAASDDWEDGGAAATLVHAYFDTGTRVLGIAYAGTVVGLVRIKIGPETDAAALHTLLLDHRFRGLGVANAALDSIPMVVIAGDIPTHFYGKHPHQEQWHPWKGYWLYSFSDNLSLSWGNN